MRLEFSVYITLLAALWLWVKPASYRYEYQEYFLEGKGTQCIGLTTLPPPGILRACTGIASTSLSSILEHEVLNIPVL
jgi:hypothetical protein